ncbi:hypothetical protein HQ393_14785 [Chitinibacter bivalviorum]|uniref:Uncharacterized protein n=1 Tax=Chitinibacter bivalviorum TaxID=2739434 RepID=A0A7H9BL56_9NEIS|nr:hypothetical protein [Chitinibacter bivalviorum]QLG89410.1 hypothetical protein HQ393_14785 [Chitinibacter bivalviorum]
MRDFYLTVHFLGLVMGAGSGFALFVLSFVLPRITEGARREMAIGLFTLRYVSYAGLLVLMASGVLLLRPLWPAMQASPWLHAKLGGVAIIAICAVFGVHAMRQPRPNAATFRRLALLGKISVVASVLVVMAAVQSFH